MREITTPLTGNVISELHAGDRVEITGTIYTARDQAHKRLVESIEKGKPLPFNIEGQIIYYAGPSPTPPGKPVGSIGPTTSARMDVFTQALLSKGLKATIGKGPRSAEVKHALAEYKAVYFATVGGIAALLSSYVKKAEVLAYPDLGPEAIYRLEVEKFPVVVAIDAHGVDLYEKNREIFRQP